MTLFSQNNDISILSLNPFNEIERERLFDKKSFTQA